MQRLQQSLLSLARLGYTASAAEACAARVGAASSSAACSWGLPSALCSTRQQTTATAAAVAKLDRADPNYLQHLKRALRPENSERNRFRRKWRKALQMKVRRVKRTEGGGGGWRAGRQEGKRRRGPRRDRAGQRRPPAFDMGVSLSWRQRSRVPAL